MDTFRRGGPPLINVDSCTWFALDAELRNALNGSRSLDDVVIELLARKEAGEPFGIDIFLCFIPISRGHQVMAVSRWRQASDQIPPTISMSSVGLFSALTRHHFNPASLSLKSVFNSRAADSSWRPPNSLVSHWLELNVTM